MLYTKQKGGALIEFAISVPLIIIFLIGILSSGRLLNTVSTVGQAAFLGAQLGSQVNAKVELSKIPDRIVKILDLQSRKLHQVSVTCKDPLHTSPTDPQNRCITSANGSVFFDPDPNSVDAKRVLKVHVNGKLPTIFRELDIDIDVTAPILLLDQGTTINLNQPENPALTYGCQGGLNNANCNCCSSPVRGDLCGIC